VRRDRHWKSVAATLLIATLLWSTGCMTQRAVHQAACGDVEPGIGVPTEAPVPDELHVLALSAGGPWGGFGIGFLEGWSQAPPAAGPARPRFDIAVGVSTGAIFVTHAFLGSEYDPVLRAQLFSLSTAGVYKRRPILAALAGDSVASTRPLRERLERVITPQVLDHVADAWLHEGRRLAVIAVDMDCGKPELLDLTAVALQRDRSDRAARYIDYLMASSASPVAFPPVFIDGRMMVDGALRQHIPFPSQIKRLLAGRERPGQRVNLFVIVNSPRVAIPQCITDHVLLVALRTGDVWTGERANDSLALAMTDAARRGWTARYVAPDGDPCQPVPPPEDYFNPVFMQCQFEFGRRLAMQDESPWQERIDSLPPFELRSVTQRHPCAH
jgi:predicted acylesterase/phospholipase RssA